MVHKCVPFEVGGRGFVVEIDDAVLEGNRPVVRLDGGCPVMALPKGGWAEVDAIVRKERNDAGR